MTLSSQQKQELAQSGLLCLAAAVFATGCQINWGWATQLLYVDSVINSKLWNPIAMAGTLLNLAVVGLSVLCCLIHEPAPGKLSSDYSVVFLLCFPSGVLATAWVFFQAVFSVLLSSCDSYGQACLAISRSLFFIATVVLISRPQTRIEDDRSYRYQFIHFGTQLLTGINLLSITIYSLVDHQIHLLLTAFGLVNQNTCDMKQNAAFYNMWINTLTRFRWIGSTSIIVFGLSCSIMLLDPLVRHYRQMQRIRQLNQHEPGIEPDVDNESESKWCSEITVGSTILGIIFIAGAAWKLTQRDNSLLLPVLEFLVYGVSIVLTPLQLRLMARWPLLTPSSNMSRLYRPQRLLLWVGLFGEMIHAFAMVTACSNIGVDRTKSGMYIWLILAKYVAQVVQNVGQILVVDSLLQRRWLRSTSSARQDMALLYTQFHFMANLGLSLCIFLIVQHSFVYKFEVTKDLEYLMKLFYCFGSIFSILYRLQGSIIFGCFLYFLIRNKFITFTDNVASSLNPQ